MATLIVQVMYEHSMDGIGSPLNLQDDEFNYPEGSASYARVLNAVLDVTVTIQIAQ